MLTIAVVVSLVGVFTLQNASAQVRTDQQTRVEEQTEIVADRIGSWLAEQRETTRALSNHGTMNGGSEAAKRSLLRDEMERLPNATAAIHVVERRTDVASRGNNETILLSTTTGFEGQNLSVTNSYWPPSTGLNFDSVDETLISWTYSDDGRPTVAVASPTLSGDRIVVVEYRTDQQAAAFSEVIGSADTKVLGDATGLVLVDENTSNVLTQYQGNASQTAAGSRILASETGSDLGGSVVTDDDVVGYADVGQGIGWIAVRETPKSEVFGIVSDIQRAIGGLVLITILGFLGVMVVVRRGPIRSIQELEEQGEALSEGDLSVEPTESDRVDEIGRLQTAFVDIHRYMQTVARQATTIADEEFDDAALDEEIPGPIGESMDTMSDSLERSLAESEQARREAEQAQREAERARENAEELSTLLQNEADRFAAVMRTAAAGNFSKRLETDSDNEAMREIATAFNEMIGDIESTIEESQAFAGDVARTSATADESVADAKRASEQVSQSVQTIASGANEQREHLQEVSEEMSSHSATIEEVAATADTVATKAADTASAAREGEETAREAMAETENVAETMAETVEKVDELDALMSEVDDIVELIAEIAEQTNMLALNANIEAARADTDGTSDGFNVVAEEVKDLAGETQSSAEDVADLIEQMKTQTELTVDEIRTAEAGVTEAMESVEAAVEVFSEVAETTGETNDGVQEISRAMDDQAASTEEVVSMTETVADISEQTADESGSVSAAAEEQAASMTEVSDSVKTIAERAEQLEAQLERFETTSATDPVEEAVADGGD